jgi:hypothetical protein
MTLKITLYILTSSLVVGDTRLEAGDELKFELIDGLDLR